MSCCESNNIRFAWTLSNVYHVAYTTDEAAHLFLVDRASCLAGKLALIANSPHSQPGALCVFPQRLTLTGSLRFLLGGQPPAVNLPPLPIVLLLTGRRRPPSPGSMQLPPAGALQPLSPVLHLTHWPAAQAQVA